MNDRSFDQRARAWLQLGPLKAPVESVQAVLAAIETVPQDHPVLWPLGRPRPLMRGRSAMALAAAAALVVAVLAGSLLGQRGPDVATTPSPSTSVPDTTGLLAGYPEATVRLSKSVGSADVPVSAESKVERIEVGHLDLQGPFVVGIACRGAGKLRFEVSSGGAEPFMNLPVTCDGAPFHEEYLSAPQGSSAPGVARPTNVPANAGQEVAVSVAAGASWRVAIGEYPADLTARPEFPPVQTTSGWNQFLVVDPPQVGRGLGAAVDVPENATRLGVFVQCTRPANVSVSAGTSSGAVTCPTTGAGQRVELAVTGGSTLDVTASADELTWLRLVIETDGELGRTYPAAPPLPAGISEVAYAAGNDQFLALGTLGSSRQTIVPMPWARPGLAAGDLVAVGWAPSGTQPTRLELWSISEGRALRTLAEVSLPSLIFESWVDGTHRQVFYSVFDAAAQKVEYRRVAVDGSGDQVVASVPMSHASTGRGAALALDDSVFVADACAASLDCVRDIVDAATLERRTVQLPTGETCALLGVIDGLVVESTARSCNEETYRTTAIPLDGGERRTLADGRIEGTVVASSAGARIVYWEGVGEGQVFRILDIASGAVDDIDSSAWGVQESWLMVERIRLPGDWVLLSAGLGDFPGPKTFRGVPRLINVVTGEQIELVNLPNSSQ